MTGPELYGAPALYCPWPRFSDSPLGAAFTLPRCALRGSSGGATMTTLGAASTPLPKHCNYLRARRTGFYQRVGASTSQASTLRFVPLPCRNASLPCTSHDGGRRLRGSPIPLQAAIKAHSLCEENAHLQHIQRLSERYSALEFRCRAGLACSPLQGSPAFLLPAPRPDALSPLPL